MLAGEPIAFKSRSQPPETPPDDDRALAPLEDLAPADDGRVALPRQLPGTLPRSSAVSIGVAVGVETSLSLTIPPNLLRAVDLCDVMAGFGTHWRSIQTKPGDHELSKTVDSIGDFLSHNWSTPPLQKTAALHFAYNLKPAIMCGHIGALVACFVNEALFPFGPQVERAEGRSGLGCLITGTIAFAFALAFWQRLRGLVGRARLVFLDKLCIDQVDPKNKADGILSIAAFLRNSDRLMILWTPDYFTRLWCTFEVVIWSFLARDFHTSVKLVPVNLAAALLLSSITFLAGCFFAAAGNVVVIGVVNLCGTLALIKVWRKHGHDAKAMQSQLRNFSMTNANCFCCSNDHKDPITGTELMCDRRLVYQALKEWGDIESSQDLAAVLQKSERRVTGDLTDLFQTMQVIEIGYKDSVILNSFWFWRALDVVPRAASQDWQAAVHLACYWAALGLAVVPTWWACMSRLCNTLPSAAQVEGRGRIREILKDVLCSIVVVGVFLIQYLPLAMATRDAKGDPRAQVVWIFILIAVCVVGHRQQIRKCRLLSHLLKACR
eukprot:TRINITY_DN20742_c0_g2_i4.p1 TRINITY_DN20742_c0_g2~~TRINITY_DN20742_c0_g2_i4.p1  ORF type:complete len:550 (+),score=22.80 TRINITY_DN20742_c0_g2_i4:81-1730(+)